MNRLARIGEAWRQDRLLRTILKNSGYLFSSQTISMGLTSLQGILAAFLLGPDAYGVLGMVVAFASNVNRLLSFRMGELVVKYAGQMLELGKKQQAAAVIKAAGLAEALTSLVAYGLLVLCAPLAATYIVKDPSASPWLIFYGLALLANLVTETSTAILQLSEQYRSQAVLNLVQSVLTAGWVLAAFLLHAGLFEVLTGYLAGKAVFGIGIAFLAARQLRPLLGEGWWRASLRLTPSRRELLHFAISTNLSGTINMLIRDSEVLWVGFFLDQAGAGYYKFAQAVVGIISMPVSPLINTTFPEISRTVARREWASLRRVLRRTMAIAGGWSLACTLGALVFGPWFLAWFKQGEYGPAYGPLLILLLGYGVANTLFWNRPLLLAFGRPDYPLKATAWVGLAKTILMFVLTPALGVLAQAGLLSAYLALSVGLIVRRGLSLLRQAESQPLAEG